MIYDNAYCLSLAKHLVERHGHDLEQLTKEISGELCRFHKLGQISITGPITKALKLANSTTP